MSPPRGDWKEAALVARLSTTDLRVHLRELLRRPDLNDAAAAAGVAAIARACNAVEGVLAALAVAASEDDSASRL